MINGVVDIPLAVVGCDFRVASSRYRSRLVLSAEEVLELAAALKKNQATDGFVDLNTCNRNEWLVSSRDPRWAAELLRSQMVARAGSDAQPWLNPYVYTGEQAARHVFQVAIGQESLVVGERQIAGQLYRALEKARDRGTSSRVLNGLGTAAGRLVRIALRRGCIGNAAVGVHSLATGYLEHWRAGRPARVALVGLGRIGRRIQGMLEADPHLQPILVNRTVPDDQAERVRPIADLAEALAEADAAIVCTGAPTPLVRAEHLRPRPANRRLLLIDIGIPEQVERASTPVGVELAGLDELSAFYRRTFPGARRANRREIESLAHKALSEFRVFCQEPAFSAILDTVQKHHRQLVHEEIPSLVQRRLAYLPQDARACLEQDLRNIVLEYTSEVFRTVKEASLRLAESAECPNEP